MAHRCSQPLLLVTTRRRGTAPSYTLSENPMVPVAYGQSLCPCPPCLCISQTGSDPFRKLLMLRRLWNTEHAPAHSGFRAASCRTSLFMWQSPSALALSLSPGNLGNHTLHPVRKISFSHRLLISSGTVVSGWDLKTTPLPSPPVQSPHRALSWVITLEEHVSPTSLKRKWGWWGEEKCLSISQGLGEGGTMQT